jgi:hypothetical protein
MALTRRVGLIVVIALLGVAARVFMYRPTSRP